MKINLLFAITLIATVSSNAFAIEIVKGKLLEHKQWSTLNNSSTATFEESAFNQAKLANLLNRRKTTVDCAYLYANAHLDPIPTDVKYGTTVKISGTINVAVANNTSNSKTYVVEQGVCVSQNPEYQNCMAERNLIQLDSGGYFDFDANAVRNITFNKTGLNYVSVYSEIESDENDHTYFSTSDDGVIDVKHKK